jgi:hypothetical protein
MVLENSSSSSNPDFYSDSPQSSDNDTYSNQGSSDSDGGPPVMFMGVNVKEVVTNNPNLHFPNVESPWPFLLPELFGSGKTMQGMYTLKYLVSKSKMIGRPLSADEGQAFAEMVGSWARIQAWGTPVGILAGGYRTWATRATYKIPFMKEQPGRFAPENREKLKVLFFRGQQAIWAQQTMRTAAYVFLSNLFSTWFFQTYAFSVLAVKQSADPRLKDINEWEKNERADRMKKLPKETKPAPGRIGTLEDENMRRAARTMYGRQDMNDQLYNSQDQGQEQPETPQRLQTNDYSNPQRDMNPTLFEMEQPSQKDSEAFFDDASPTAPEEQSDGYSSSQEPQSPYGSRQSQGRQQQQQQQQGGSAWARIRGKAGLQAQESPPTSSWDQRRDVAGSIGDRGNRQDTGDTFSFSKTDEEKQLAKAQAQREFDERVERERRGGDFGSK